MNETIVFMLKALNFPRAKIEGEGGGGIYPFVQLFQPTIFQFV